MPAKNGPIFSNNDTRTWVQESGPGTAFSLFGCHALTGWTRDFAETIYIKCKSPNEYGKMIIKEAIPGEPGEPTFTVDAYTQQEEDFLFALDCPVDFQVHYGSCNTPGNYKGYTKIRHFYRATIASQGESDVDFLNETPGEIVLSAEFSCEEIVEIVQVAVVQSNNGVTEAQGFNDIAMLASPRCEGDCGAEIQACKWGVTVADSNYGVATANVWITTDGATWEVAAVDPFSENDANISSCVILPGTTAPIIIVFRGNVSGIYGARASISDDWGASWSEVNMGGITNGSNVNGVYAFTAGLIFAVGNGGYIWRSEDQGETWEEFTGTDTGTAEELWDIHTPDGVNMLAVGDNNTVLKSTDGGDSYTTPDGPADGAQALFTVQCLTQFKGIVGGEIDGGEDCLWFTPDGATTWAGESFNGSTTADGQVRRVRVAKKAPIQHMVMLHGVNNGATRRWGPGTSFYFFRTLDGGGSWERQNLITNNGLNGLSVCTINKAFACGEAVSGVAEIQKMSS